MSTSTAAVVALLLSLAAAAVIKSIKSAFWSAGYAQGFSDGYEEGETPEVYTPSRKDGGSCAMKGMPYCLQCPNRRAIIREQAGNAEYDTGEWVCTYKKQEGDDDMQRTIKPMLFNTDMVRAILDGKKTMTRRLVKPQPPATVHIAKSNNSVGWSWWEDGDLHEMKQPYHAGDILYVRETWSKYEDGEYAYRTDYGDTEDDSFPPSMLKWRPSIHMPKEAARIFLRVKDVHLERLQDIDSQGIGDEGIPRSLLDTIGEKDYRMCFEFTWDATVKRSERDKYGWAANPWVWVIEFERITKDEALGATARAGQE